MASLVSVRELIEAANVSMADRQIEAIAKQCGDFNHERALTTLNMLDSKEISAKQILAAIRKNHLNTNRQYCGYCRESWIPLLDADAWKEAGSPEYKHAVFIPKREIACPNCNKQKTRAQQVIDTMPDDVKGWSFVILFDYIRYVKETDISPKEFDPSAYWSGLSIQPMLTQAMRDVMDWIHEHKPAIAEPHTHHHAVQTFQPIQSVADEYIAIGKRRLGVE